MSNTELKHVEFEPQGVCSRRINFDIDGDGKLRNIVFSGGCPGNTFGVAALCEGVDAREALARLRGIDCRGRGTSCPDQFATAIAEALLG